MSFSSQDQSQNIRSGSSSLPDSTNELLLQALAIHREKRLDEAVALYQEILEIEPNHVQACFNLGSIFHAQSDLPAAISYYQEVVALEPDNFQALYVLADAFRDHGCREEAIGSYRKALALNDTYPEPHYNLGILYYQQGEYDQALASFRSVIDIDPLHADSLYNTGMVHFDSGDYENAAVFYEKALVARPDDVDTLYNLAFTRAKLGQLEKAALHYHEAIELAPDDAELHNSLGSVLRKLNEPEMAEFCYRQAVAVRDDYGTAWTNLATILHILGQYDEALECYSKAIELGDHTESADYMMAALTGSNRQISPRIYVRELYDGYAENFENSLVGNLKYNTPKLLRKTCSSIINRERRFSRAADLGCGTGLVGVQFHDVVDQLVGVDLSEKMLAKAGEKDIYDELHCDDIVEFLDKESTRDFDLVMAADVLIYLGELENFFKSLSRRVKSGGYLLFSTERLDSKGGYSLLKTGRYSHSEDYIGSLATKYGFKVEVCREVDLRKEKDKWLRGCIFALQRF